MIAGLTSIVAIVSSRPVERGRRAGARAGPGAGAARRSGGRRRRFFMTTSGRRTVDGSIAPIDGATGAARARVSSTADAPRTTRTLPSPPARAAGRRRRHDARGVRAANRDAVKATAGPKCTARCSKRHSAAWSAARLHTRRSGDAGFLASDPGNRRPSAAARTARRQERKRHQTLLRKRPRGSKARSCSPTTTLLKILRRIACTTARTLPQLVASIRQFEISGTMKDIIEQPRGEECERAQPREHEGRRARLEPARWYCLHDMRNVGEATRGGHGGYTMLRR